MTAISARDMDARGARRLICAILVQAVRDALGGDTGALDWLSPIAGEIVDAGAARGKRYESGPRPKAQAATHCRRGHEYTPENTRTTARQRQCRVCARMARKATGTGI